MVAIDLCKAYKMQMAARSQANKIIKCMKNVPTKTTTSLHVMWMCFCIMSLQDFYKAMQITRMNEAKPLGKILVLTVVPNCNILWINTFSTVFSKNFLLI